MTNRGTSPRLTPAVISLLALLIALTTIFTLIPRVPIAATQGYINLSAVAVTFCGLLFGPLIGAVAGGVGTALADVFGGYAQFALLSLLAHGLEGLLIGLLGQGRRSLLGMAGAWLAGAAAMVAVYFLGEALILTGLPAAVAEVPVNAIQAVAGAVVGIPLAVAVRRAYPPIVHLGRPRSWREE